MVSINTSETKAKVKASLKRLPRDAAIEAYKWILGLSTKGKVTAYIKANHTKEVLCIWQKLRAGLRWDIYYMRLWKGVSTFYIEDCRWCMHYCGSRCGYYSKTRCKYTYSISKASKIFNLDRIELRRIRKAFSLKDVKKFKAFLRDTVTVVVTASEEKEYNTKIVKEVLDSFTKTRGIASKVYKGRYLGYYYGISKEDIESELHSHLVVLVKRYDYLGVQDLIRTCSRSLGNHLRNIMASYNTQKRKDLSKSVAVDNEGGDLLLSVPEDAPSPEDRLIVKDVQDTTLKVLSTLEGEFKLAMEVLLGKERLSFTSFLQGKSLVKDEHTWDAFYTKVEPDRLMTLLNEFSGIDLQHALQEKWISFNKTREEREEDIKFVNQHYDKKGGDSMSNDLLKKVRTAREKAGTQAVSFLPPKEEKVDDNFNEGGEENMEDDIIVEDGTERNMIPIQVPKAKCAICGYWVPWLKKEPEDCSPSYPGCPLHTYAWEKAFPIEQAADQLIDFLSKDDNESIKEFVEAAPNIADILNAALGTLMELLSEEESGEDASYQPLDGSNTVSEDDDSEDEEEDEVMVVGKIDAQ